MSEVGRITAIIDGDISGLRSAMQQAHSAAVSGVSGIESDMRSKIGSGLSGAISGGNWQSVGKNIGSDLVQNITAPFGAVGNVAGSMATALGPVGIAAIGAAAGVAVVGSAAISAAADWQVLMAGVSKTSGLGESGISELSKQLTDISTKSPIAASELANIAAVAGSLGVGNGLNDSDKAKAIAGFSDVASQMAVAFEMPAEEAATRSAKILTAFNQPIDTKNMEALGNVVNTMGDSYAATESQVLDFTNRASYLNTTFGLSIPQVAAWGTTLISAGMESETASTGIKSLMNMSMDPKKFDEFAAAAGMSSEELRDSLNEDVIGTYSKVADKISSGTDAVEKFQTVSKLAGTEGMTTLMKMAGKGDTLQEATGLAEGQTKLAMEGKKGSMEVTFDVQAGTFNAQIQLLKNQAGAILRDIGGPILQAVTPAIAGMGTALGSVRQIGENLWGPMTAALSVPIAAIGGIATALGTVASIGLEGLVAATGAINTGFETGKAFVGAFYEEIAKIVTSSSAFQTLSGYVGQVTSAFQSLSSGASEVFDKVVSGLTNAIPTAVSGTVDALGTLADKAGLGGLVDATEGATGFLGNVYNNAATKLGWSKSTEEAVADGAKKGMEKGVEDSKDGITESLGDTVQEAFAKANDAYWKGSTSKGMQLVDGKIIGGNDSSSSTIHTGQTERFSTLLDNYVATHFSGKSIEQGGFWKVFDDSGKVVAEKVFDLGAWRTSMQPVVLDLEKYLSTSADGLREKLTTALKDGVIDAQVEKPMLFDSLQMLNAIQSKYPVEFEAAGLGKLRKDIEDTIMGKPVEVQVTAKWGAYDTKSLEELIFDPEKLKKTVVNIDRFFKGTMIPEIEKKAEDARAAWLGGEVTQDEIYQSFIAPMEKLTEYTPTWLETLNNQFKMGAIDAVQYADLLDGMIGKNEKVKESADATKESIAGMFYGMEGTSDQWKDYVNSEGGYIGPTKYYGGYAEDKYKDMQEAAAVNEKWGVAGLGSISQIKVDADMSPAEEKKTAFETAIAEANPSMALQVDMARADEQLNAFLTKVITSDPWMTVHVQFIPDVDQMVEMAMAAVDQAIVDKYGG